MRGVFIGTRPVRQPLPRRPDRIALPTQIADAGIAFIAFTLRSIIEARRGGMRAWWLPIPASLLVGTCFATPLFLFRLARERSQRRLTTATAESSDYHPH